MTRPHSRGRSAISWEGVFAVPQPPLDQEDLWQLDAVWERIAPFFDRCACA